MANVYEIVTEQIIKKLEQGVIPWRKPWINRGNVPVNWLTQKPYRGINTMILDPGEYATFKQINEFGGKIKKGAAGSIVVFWKWIDKVNDEGQAERIPFLRYYKVWEINTQVEGLNSRRKNDEVQFEHDPIEEAEKIIAGFINKPNIKYASDRAYYSPALDFVSVPPLVDYHQPVEYYSTLFHELGHSTGHPSRLKRNTLIAPAAFGSEIYSKEELVAEMSAAMLAGFAGFSEMVLDNSAAYINSWLRKLKEDSRMVVMAASQAQKAVDHILGNTFNGPEEC
ncbi:MAG: ArdC family protein [Clostridia bacterium]